MGPTLDYLGPGKKRALVNPKATRHAAASFQNFFWAALPGFGRQGAEGGGGEEERGSFWEI